jgi:hypothetical protein
MSPCICSCSCSGWCALPSALTHYASQAHQRVAACRLSWDRKSRERRLAEEATLNRRESRAAVTFLGVWLFLLPFGLGFFVSRGIAEPAITFIQARAG